MVYYTVTWVFSTSLFRRGKSRTHQEFALTHWILTFSMQRVFTHQTLRTIYLILFQHYVLCRFLELCKGHA